MLKRYEQAAALAPEKIPGLMRNRMIEPQWTGDGDRFLYQRQTDTGEEFVLVDPATGVREVVPAPEPAAAAAPGLLTSTDGTFALLCRDHDLWSRDLASGSETRLTDTGEEAFGWGELPENSNMFVPFRRMGMVLPPLGTVLSPSGRHVVTMRIDQRGMVPRHMVEQVAAGGARPECHEIRVQLEDEGTPPPAECLVLDLVSGTCTKVDATDGLVDGLMTNGASEITWSDDESRLYVLSARMGGSLATLVEVDTATGARRDVVTLDEGPLYEPNQFLYSLPLVHVLPGSGEAVLFSQRDGWGHLYLYDLTTGECRHRITSGELVVRDLLRVDEEKRELLFLAGCGENGHNPYWRKLYRASLDGGDQELLTPEAADHELPAPQPQFFHLVFGQGKPVATGISPSGRFFVDHQSKVDEPPVILLRDASKGGEVVLELERTDVSRLEAAGYVAPTTFCVKADDGETDLWGVLSLPSDPVDPTSIPVVEYIYAGFQTSTVPPSYVGGGKTTSNHSMLPAYNALGFAALIVEGRGTPGRNRDFRQWTHRQGHTTRGLEDHVTAIKALKAEHPALDLDRVGVVGHSYGGFNAARCLLMFPDFFKAAVSSAGVHEARKMPYGSWRWFLGDDYARDSEEFVGLGNLHLAERLAGDLLIACGEIDENATVDHSYVLADALMKAGKRFDLKIWPGLNHYQLTPYVQMSFWDHFVQHLLGEELPADYRP